MSVFGFTFLTNTFDGAQWNVPQLAQVALKRGDYSEYGISQNKSFGANSAGL